MSSMKLKQKKSYMQNKLFMYRNYLGIQRFNSPPSHSQ